MTNIPFSRGKTNSAVYFRLWVESKLKAIFGNIEEKRKRKKKLYGN